MTFWAKTGEGEEYLPLAEHLADAAAVAQRLWDVALTPRQRAWVAEGLGVHVSSARAWVGFLAGVHDIGKANPHFQALVPELARRILPERLRRSLGTPERLRHDVVSGAVLATWLRDRGASPETADRLAATVSGHHGVPRASEDVGGAERRVLRPNRGWEPSRMALVDELADTLGVGGLPSASSVATIVATAGLVSVADWIASDASRFPVRTGARAPAAVLAEGGVRQATWSWTGSAQRPTFEQLFGRTPRPTQSATIDALATVEENALLLIEDRTGSGKTEAALWVVQHALGVGARGAYVGLPTRATADQMHGRVAAFLARLDPDAASAPRLLHGGVHPDDDVPQPQ